MTFLVKIVPPGLDIEIGHFLVEMAPPGLGNLCQVLHSGSVRLVYFIFI